MYTRFAWISHRNPIFDEIFHFAFIDIDFAKAVTKHIADSLPYFRYETVYVQSKLALSFFNAEREGYGIILALVQSVHVCTNVSTFL